MSTNPEPTAPSAPRNRDVKSAVAAALSNWSNGDRTQDATGEPQLSEAGAAGKDAALLYLDELMQSPLGKAWIDDPALRTDTGGSEVKRPGVIAPLPRRKLISPAPTSKAVPAQLHKVEVEAGLFSVVIRVMIWILGYARYKSLTLWDSLRGKSTIRRKAHHFRTTLEKLGPTFVKLGQQLSLRADIL